MKFYTTITPRIKRQLLFRGTPIASLGILLLSYGGVFLSPSQLNIWGIPLVLLSIMLIAIGLIPYRRLCRLESTPDCLVLDTTGMTLVQQGKRRYMIPHDSIEKMEYIEKGGDYGIGIWLKQPIPEKVVVYDPRFDMQLFQNKMVKRYGCPLYLSRFSRRTFAQINLA